jgi:Protein of unknown function (DUF3106)
MNRPGQARWSAALCAAGLCATLSLAAQISPASSEQAKLASNPASIMPPLPQSPIAAFRNLLLMTPKERADYLTNRPPEIRERILAKVHEYLALDPNERELRLRATELRWCLMPLLREAPADRAPSLARVPDDLRELVNSRLDQWDALPEQLRREFLDNERTLRYFARVNSTNHPPTAAEQSQWDALPAEERQKITDQFNQFFELTPDEKQKALNTLSAAEREQMEKTLQTFSHLPPGQRIQCVRAFTEFASMSPQDRAEFLKNAERWSQMTPKERQAWRDLVAQIPIWPPLPPGLIRPPKLPPLPSTPALSPQRFHPQVATNHE